MALLEMNDVTQRFGGLIALSCFNIRIEENSLTGLIGPNGAGKTTVFNLASGFYHATEGGIIFDGYKYHSKLEPHEVTNLGMARTFQNIRLWSDMTVLDNICVSQYSRLGYGLLDAWFNTGRYGREEKRVKDKASHILEVMELSDVAEEMPKNLPYGLQRRVELARALSTDPKLLLLDEPAAGLNSSDVDGLIKHIGWIYDQFKIAIWMIEHQMKVVMSLCQHITVMEFGQIIASGTPQEIQSNPDVIKAYLGDENV
ncbi:MAG: high-affinity branched-chain amino acid ABC transporter ATP-binding protein LivG [Desulfovibrio sp. MES5]|uniref:ABC transporter ATP-binding protein n=1 Tax=Desulfovibrio sp. MES5 TaxID=1899016 RepID=UPI000B9CB11B|nr:ABC transporter ATP-binding protein [Desulfovibrio sp. MES5]OXS27635.1 MAG: high-affinity branched-chain amino acid ABC transporter ATP-binding protein LivG [Desulfovibrio sp. MES5]